MAGFNNNNHQQHRMQQKIIGANEDMFLKAFDSTPKLNIGTQKKLENELSRVVSIISNPHADWDSRVQAMKHFRTLINSGQSEDFYITTLKSLEIPFQNNICDLRSQVVRETCITIAFLSCRLQQKFSRMAEILLPSLIKLIPNSAKIISTSALVALRFIIQSTHNSKLITIIKYQLSTSKSKDIHRALCEISEQIVTTWQPNIIERHINDFQEVLRLGICDSDESARQHARRAFNIFAEHFREPADRLFNSLDPQRQRMLNNLNHGGGSTLSMNNYPAATYTNLAAPIAPSNPSTPNSGGIGSSIATGGASGPTKTASSANYYSSSTTTNTTNTTSGTSLASASHRADIVSRLKSTLGKTRIPSPVVTPPARTASAIDVAAQRRAMARSKIVYLRDGDALYKAASYLSSVIKDNSIAESQIVTTIKYFNSLIEKHPRDIVSQLLPELMPPLVIGVDNAAISVRKASIFSMVAIYAKVGLEEMETYLTSLTTTQRKLLDVYIEKITLSDESMYKKVQSTS